MGMLDGKVALKIQSSGIAHKSDCGGVALNLETAKEVRGAYESIIENARAHVPDARIEGVLVEAMAPPGIEVILGISHDPTFGPMLMAGLDGIENKIDPGDPVDRNTYELSAEEAAKIPTVPGSLDEAMDALEQDHQYLLKGGVFTQDVIDVWIDYKRTAEIDPIRLRPHPWEFHLYFDV